MRPLAFTTACAVLAIAHAGGWGRAAAPPAEAEPARVGAPQTLLERGPEAVKKARGRGEATAARDIKAGRPVILYFGKPWSQGKPLVDEATGLRVVVVAGCLVTEAFVAEVDAYNAAIRVWHGGKKAAP